MSPDRPPVADMRTACRLLREFTNGLDAQAFGADRKSQSAVLYQFVVLGEAAKRISMEFRLRHPQIPWRPIAGLRDRLVHSYDRVDINLVWDTLELRIPDLAEELERILAGANEL